MSMTRFVTIIICVTLSFSTFSQSPNIQRLERRVKVHFDLEEFFLAIPDLETLVGERPDNALYNYQLGVAHWFSSHHHQAYPYFKKAEELGHPAEKLPLFRARSEHIEHHFSTAIKFYKQYRTGLNPSTVAEEEEFRKIERYIQQCHVGNILISNPLEVRIEHMNEPINSKYPEYVPVVDAEEKMLVFTSCRPENKGGGKDLNTGHFFEDIFISRNENGSWSAPVPISGKVNTSNHDANVGLSPDGKHLITYKGHAPGGGDLYLSAFETKGNGKVAWSSPKVLPEPINTIHQEPSASFSSGMEFIFFSSDRPGGYGGLDIYYSQKGPDGSWGEAINLGPIVNSELHEDAPFIHADGKTLFFSSKGHTNMGGFDIFYSEYDSLSGRWLVPENIGYPINTADDDIYFNWTSDAIKGYYSSFRSDTYGEKDLYVVHRPNDEEDVIVLKGYVTDSISGDPIDGNITLTKQDDKELVGVYPTDPKTGKYVIPVKQGASYDLAVESDGYTYYEGALTIPRKTAYFEMTQNMNVKPFKMETTLAFSEPNDEIQLGPDGMTPLEPQENSFEEFDAKTYNDNIELTKGDKIILRSVYFDFDKAKLKPESYAALDDLHTMMEQQGHVIMEVSGHTDSLGSPRYNKRLSKRRAKAVAKYLVKKKDVKRKRLVAVGFGESQPIASNVTEEGRALNRRTEFRVIRELDLSSYAADDRVDLNDLGDDAGATTKQAPKAPNAAYTEGEVLPYKVHFPYGWETEITDYSKSKLEMVAAVMKANNELKLRIHSHADPLGASLEDNRTVSDLRANTVKDYLTSRGIGADRLEIASYGAERPLVNSNDIATNVVNRRVEFEVIR